MGLFSLRGGIEGLTFFRYEKTRKRGLSFGAWTELLAMAARSSLVA